MFPGPLSEGLFGKAMENKLWKLLSRRIPALLTKTSILPHFFTVSSTISLTASKSVTLAPFAIASPPFDLICSTTALAESLAPLPSTDPPRSFTTTFAPLLANSIACSLPRPPPAPVTITTFSSNLIDIFFLIF